MNFDIAKQERVSVLDLARVMHSSLKHFPIGPIWLRLRRALNFGLSVELNTFLAKWHYLGIVRSFPPLNSGAGTVDCFMLLNDARIWEGLWSLYSFRTYFGPCRIIVLNDGTLKPASIELLRTVFPGILIPDFETNDNEMDAYLAQRRLRRCREWRKRFVFFRKLVDSIKLAQAGGLILLDSDCLHFRVPLEVTKWAEKPVQVRYIADIDQYSLCASPSELARICRCPLPEYFCAGYLCVPRGAVDFDRVEHYLAEDCFERQLSTRQFTHVAEQTLYAMEAAIVGAAILPTDYATCPDLDVQTATMGHFCSGTYQRTWFYTKGLPLVSRQLQFSLGLGQQPTERSR